MHLCKGIPEEVAFSWCFRIGGERMGTMEYKVKDLVSFNKIFFLPYPK